jgi:tRNA (cytidine/uridine-2'-O-)-methyltransferase
MPLALALYQPDIPHNTGTLLRLGACFGIAVHVIHPTGFPLTRQSLKRGGLDYLDSADMVEHDSFAFSTSDIVMVGRESAGVPENVAAAADHRIRIPMRPNMRSINVALAAALTLGEAMRQTGGFAALR